MKQFKYILICFLMAFIVGCAAFNEYIKDNPALTYVGVSTAVSQYIKKKSDGDMLEAKNVAERVLKHLKAIRSQLTENSEITSIASLVDVVKIEIGYHKMDPADKLAIDNILFLAQSGVKTEAIDLGLDDETKVSVNKILDAAEVGASVYL